MRYSKLVHHTCVMCVIKCALGQNCGNWRILFVLNTTFCEKFGRSKKRGKLVVSVVAAKSQRAVDWLVIAV